LRTCHYWAKPKDLHKNKKITINSRGMSNPIPAPFWGAWQLMVRNPFWTCLGPLKPNGFEHDFFPTEKVRNKKWGIS
jgi:hypothetical protein